MRLVCRSRALRSRALDHAVRSGRKLKSVPDMILDEVAVIFE
jgi:hypothetical protein